MNEGQAMIQAGLMAAKHRTALFNILCRKCKMMYMNVSKANSKGEAAKRVDEVTKDQLENKTLTKAMCSRCQRRLNLLVGAEK